MTTQLAPLTVQHFTDNNGNLLAGGQLYTYAAGTSTPSATYTDASGGTPNTNPVIMNARGEANVWTSGGLAYKFVLKDSLGNLIWSVDNVTDGSVNSALAADLANTTDPTKGAAMVGTILTDAGAVGRTQSSKNADYKTAFDFGARGDGVTDDTAALQSLVNSSALVIDGLGKTYAVTQVNCKPFQKLQNFNIKKIGSATSGIAALNWVSMNSAAPISGVEIENVHVDGNRATETNILYPSTEDGGRSGFRFRGYVDGLTLTNSSASYCATDGLELFAGFSTSFSIQNVSVINSQFDYNRRHGISADSLFSVSLTNVKARNNGLTLSGETILTNGNYGANLGTATPLYGNGMDVETYGPNNHSSGVAWINCEMTGNARMGLLCLETSAWNSGGYTPWSQLKVIGGKYDKGVDPSADGSSIEGTPNTAAYTPGAQKMAIGVSLLDVDLVNGSVFFRYVSDAHVSKINNSVSTPATVIQSICESVVYASWVPRALLYSAQGGVILSSIEMTSASVTVTPSLTNSSMPGTLSGAASELLFSCSTYSIYEVSAIYTPNTSTDSGLFSISAPGSFTAFGMSALLRDRTTGKITGSVGAVNTFAAMYLNAALQSANPVDVIATVMVVQP